MNIASNPSEFLHNKNYFISLFEDKLHIYKYKTLDVLTATKIVVNMDIFNLTIIGNDLCVSKMNKEELLIRGNIYELKKDNN